MVSNGVGHFGTVIVGLLGISPPGPFASQPRWTKVMV